MLQALTWVILIQLIGLSVFPLTFKPFKRLTDRGYSFSKPIGLIVVGLTSWLLSVNGLLAPSKLLLWCIILLIAAISVIATFRNLEEIKEFTRENWKFVVFLELLFLMVYTIFVVFRYFDPSIDHTEQPMDFAFFNASILSETGGPGDPWMKGSVISYYYFGYWIFAMVTIISGTLPEITYNLSMATIPALTMLTVSGLAMSMFQKENIGTLPSTIFALISGIVTVFLSNLHGFIEFMRENAFGSTSFWKHLCIEGMTKLDLPTTQSWRPVEFWWWFKSTRIINHFGDSCDSSGLDYTITEFPFFSYILGDLHPHVTSTPFFIVFLGICFCVIQQKKLRLLNPSTLVTISLLSLMLSAVVFINMWYLPSAVAILFGVYILRRIIGPDISLVRSLLVPFMVVIIAMLILSPYLLTLQTSITGLKSPSIQTKLQHALIIWLPLFVITIPHIIIEFCRVPISGRWKTSLAIASVVAFSPWVVRILIPNTNVENSSNLILFAMPLTAMILLASITATTMGFRAGLTTRVLFLYLLAIALALILIPELIYLEDIYSNRMNTVFKLYYQAWILLSICAGYALLHWYKLFAYLSGFGRWLHRTWTVLIIFITAAAIYYVPAAMVSKAAESPVKSLNGLIYLEKHDADLKRAIDFARKNISISDGILEGVSEWGAAGIISRSTGIPTIINWPGHQNQWRTKTNEIHKRILHVEKIYTTEEVYEAKTLLNLYTTNYVLVSPKEISEYGSKGMSKFDVMGEIVFGEKNGTRIYKIEK